MDQLLLKKGLHIVYMFTESCGLFIALALFRSTNLDLFPNIATQSSHSILTDITRDGYAMFKNQLNFSTELNLSETLNPS